jgi:uncharacterized protein
MLDGHGLAPPTARLARRFRPLSLSVILAGLWLAICGALAQAPLPPSPARHLTDNAGVLKAATIDEINRRLETFEQETSTQVVVMLNSKMPDGAALDDYATRLFQAWKIGQRGKDNGVLLLIFIQDRRMKIEVGYGLEGALPDVTAKRIIEDEIGPRFRAGDYDGGVTAGVNAILAATKGEYRSTVRSRSGNAFPGGVAFFAVLGLVLGPIIRLFTTSGLKPATRVLLVASAIPVGAIGAGIGGALFLRGIIWLALIAFWFTLLLLGVGRRGNVQYNRSGRRRLLSGPSWGGWFGGGGFGGGGGSFGGGSFGGGGFSGGGGRSGGGGASGGW